MHKLLTTLLPAWLAFLLLLGGTLPAARGEGPFPATNEAGFLDTGEFVYEDPENGSWRYLSPTLRVEVTRYHDPGAPLTWTVAEIHTQGDERFHMIPKDASRRMLKWDYPDNIAAENRTVLAVTSDFAHYRLKKNYKPGIIIRDGKILSKETRGKNNTQFPPLDTLALFEDGDMQVFGFNELKAKDYLAMGATDVLAFGPLLIRDGIINEDVLDKHGWQAEPRVGVGMVEKGHYFAIMVEGRHEDSRGISTLGLAQLFAERGCTLAFNLDGGQSATMVFMGQQIVRTGHETKTEVYPRPSAEILGIGTFAQEAENEMDKAQGETAE